MTRVPENIIWSIPWQPILSVQILYCTLKSASELIISVEGQPQEKEKESTLTWAGSWSTTGTVREGLKQSCPLETRKRVISAVGRAAVKFIQHFPQHCCWNQCYSIYHLCKHFVKQQLVLYSVACLLRRLQGASTVLSGTNCCNQMVAQQVEHVGSKMSNRSRKNRSKTRRFYRNDAKDCV